jgi:hypothetical protein
MKEEQPQQRLKGARKALAEIQRCLKKPAAHRLSER